jgi:hypothetical protein
MNLRGQSVLVSSRLTLDAVLISFRLEPRRQADMGSSNFNQSLHRPFRLESQFRSDDLRHWSQ